jgi:LCP family protein required for cell wall assembly
VKRRLAIVAVGLSVIVTLAAGLVTSAAFGGIGFRAGRPVFQIHKVDEANFSATSDQPVFVLVLGHDGRPGLAGARADAIHVIGVNPAAGAATIINIPRDTYAAIPGRGMDKINAAYDYGGPRLQARAVSALVGVDLPYVITTGFEGFMSMVDELGGVEVNVPVPMADAASGAFFAAGPNHLLGGPALALSRNRNLGGGDFTRTHNQSLIIIAALAKLRGEGPSLSNVVRWLAVLLKHGAVDGAGMTDVYRLGQLALSIDPANVRTVTMPGVTGDTAAGSSVLLTAGANSLFADFRDDAILQSH